MIRYVSILLLLAAVLTACGREDPGPGGAAVKADAVTLLTSGEGFGDSGYNDLVLAALMRFAGSRDDVTLSVRRAGEEAGVRAMIEEWVESTKDMDTRSVLVLPSSGYASFIDRDLRLTGRQRILLFETRGEDLPEGVLTFRIRRYGVSYLAGLMAEKSPSAHIVAANPQEPNVAEAAKGFSDGYRRSSGREAETHYLSEGSGGFSLPGEAWRLVREWDETFVYPLAGGSNSGVYKYSRENPFTLQLVAGMDVDCSGFSRRVPFSVIIHVDRAIGRILESWIAGGDVARHTEYGLGDSGIVGIECHEDFIRKTDSFMDYYSEPDYWERLMAAGIDEAKAKEKGYYGF